MYQMGLVCELSLGKKECISEVPDRLQAGLAEWPAEASRFGQQEISWGLAL